MDSLQKTEDEQNVPSAKTRLQETSVKDDNEITLDSDHVVQPDGGWGWVVCFSCVICNGVVFGTTNCFGLIYLAIRDEFSNSGSNISFRAAWVGSVCAGTTFLLSFLAGVVSDNIGVRRTAFIGAVVALAGILGSAFVEDLMLMYLTFGLIMGFGFAFTLSQSLVILGHYFKRNLGLASGLNVSGGAIVTIGMSQALPVLLKRIGLSKTFLTMAGLVAILIPCSLTWKDVFPTRSSRLRDLQNRYKDEGLSLRNSKASHFCKSQFINAALWQDKNYMLYVAANSIGMMGYFVPYVHVVKYAQDVFPASNGSLLILCLAGTGGISRLVIGKIADFRWISWLRLVVLGLGGYGLCTICLPFPQSFEGLVALCIVLGLFDGPVICGLAPIIFELVGQKNMTQAVGIAFVGMGFTTCAGPPLAGLLYDIYGIYNSAFYAAGGVVMLAGVMTAFVKTPNTVHGSSSAQ